MDMNVLVFTEILEARYLPPRTATPVHSEWPTIVPRVTLYTF